MQRSTKTLVGVLAVVGSLLTWAAPASATPVTNNFKITAGTLTTAVGTYDLDPTTAPTGDCTTLPAGTIAVNVDDNAGTPPPKYTTAVPTGGVVSQTSFRISGNPQNYLLTLSRSTNASGVHTGTIEDDPNGSDVDQQVRLRAQINEGTGANGCTVGTLKCVVEIQFQLTGGLTASGPIVAKDFPTGGEVLGLGDTSPVIAGPCNAPFASLLGSNVTIAGLDLEALP